MNQEWTCGISRLVRPVEYHVDPLDKTGVLVLWDYGADLPVVFRTPGLEISIVSGPLGNDRRSMWAARRI
jgi:hypothetical protein